MKVKSQKLKVKSLIQNSKLILIIFICLFIVYLLVKNFSSSVIFRNRDKVNIVFYGENTKFFSLDKKNISYIIYFPSDVKVLVPGGYGDYRVGSLGKLLRLEKKPEIVSRTFSSATSSFVDLYFYPKEDKIYYGDEKEVSDFPSFQEIFFSSGNANLIDRIYIFSFFFKKNYFQYQKIAGLPVKEVKGEKIFDRESFYRNNLGLFFNFSYRKLAENLQIVYDKSYSTASLISEMAEGEGIRVVDISEGGEKGSCQVLTKKNRLNDLIVNQLVRFFHCQKAVGEPTVSDIILELGNIEEEWAVK